MDTLKTIWEDFNDRFKSPFVISFTISWLIWNWWLVYSVFNFDEGKLLNDKLLYINDYITNHTKALTIYPLLTSLGAALVFYIAKSIFLGLDSLYENRLRIWMIRLVGIESTIPASDLDKYRKELDLKQKEMQEQGALYATSLSKIHELEQSLILVDNNEQTIKEKNREIQDLKNAWSKVHLENNELKEQLQLPQSLELFFKGTWICEYNLINFAEPRVPNIDAEKFFIQKDGYFINSQLRFEIRNIRYAPGLKCLAFHKIKLASKDFTNTVTINKVNEYLWSGMELTNDGNISYLRFYPQDNLPKHFPVYITNEAIEEIITTNKYLERLKMLIKKVSSI